ncbi:MAG: preprotein translocase subunit SecE [Candidatus Saccharibacteria bacterium]|nr:preprotein translocase subunit SecE [Candidatus Saccharibacteria bacterium]
MSKKTSSRKKATSNPEVATRVHKVKAKVDIKSVKSKVKTETNIKSTEVIRPTKKRFSKKILGGVFLPVIALIRYLKQSWYELRRVHWPSRKSTWAMTFAVVFYAAFFLVVVLALDNLFSYLFKLMIGN